MFWAFFGGIGEGLEVDVNRLELNQRVERCPLILQNLAEELFERTYLSRITEW